MTDRVKSPGLACPRYSSHRKTSWSTSGPSFHLPTCQSRLAAISTAAAELGARTNRLSPGLGNRGCPRARRWSQWYGERRRRQHEEGDRPQAPRMTCSRATTRTGTAGSRAGRRGGTGSRPCTNRTLRTGACGMVTGTESCVNRHFEAVRSSSQEQGGSRTAQALAANLYLGDARERQSRRP